MKLTARLFAIASLLGLAAPADAGKYNKVLSIGDPAPAWADLEGVDGKKHSLADLKDRDVVVVIFTCNTCPVAADYEDRIIAFARPYSEPDSKVAVVAVNVNTVKGDQLPEMRKKAQAKQFPFPYL